MIPDRFNRRQDGADGMREGHWLILRHRANRVDIPVRIWFGPPNDPETGEIMDRSWRWRIEIAGAELGEEPLIVGNIPFNDIASFWPSCQTHPIDRHEYEYRIERQSWAALHDPSDPFATPGGKINAMTATLPFSGD